MVILMNKMNYSDCPTITASFGIDGRKVTEPLAKSLTRSIYPNGRCCRTIQPELARKHPLYELTFKQEGFRMFLYDNRHFSILRQSFVDFEGEHLENKGRHEDVGFEKYRVQFTEETHLEGDPIFECTDYVMPQDYDQCLEAEYVRQTLLLLNCTPPWLTDNQDLWCKDRLNISDQQANNNDLYFDQILDGKFPNGNCLKPCNFMRYSLALVCLFLSLYLPISGTKLYIKDGLGPKT